MRQKVMLGLVAVCTAGLPMTAAAFQLLWSNGSHDISVASAVQCTLVVRADPGEVLPQNWRMFYVTDGGDVSFMAEPHREPDVRVVCAAATAQDAAGMLGHVDSLLYCTGPIEGGEAALARAVIRLGTATRAKFAIYTAGVPPGLDKSKEATINGGPSLPYPPIIDSVAVVHNGSALELTVDGASLESVLRVEYVTRDGGAYPLSLISTSSSRATARLSLATPLPPGVLAVVGASGAVAAQAVAGEAAPLAAPWASKSLLVRFRSSEVEAPTPTGGKLSDFSIRSSTLAVDLGRAGIQRLERLLPWRTPKHTRGMTLAGDSTQLADLAELYIAHLADSTNPSAAMHILATLPQVLYVGRDYAVHATYAPLDSLYHWQWGLHDPALPQFPCGLPMYSPVNVGAEHAWDRTSGASAIRIGVLDTGINPDHPDLLGRVDPGMCFVSGLPRDAWHDDNLAIHSHGTACAGLIGAAGDNSKGVAGLDWHGRLVPIKTLDSLGNGYWNWLMQGIDWAREQQIPVVNMSLSGEGGDAGTIAALAEVCQDAYRSGMLLVASSGNVITRWGEDWTGPHYPAALGQTVLSVSAVLPDGSRWRDVNLRCHRDTCWAANYGDWLDVEAPGGRFIVTTRGGPYGDYYGLDRCNLDSVSTMGFGGTSAAAPLVAGSAALLLSAQPALSGDDLEVLLKLGARNRWVSGGAGYHREHGWGYVRIGASLDTLAPTHTLAHWSLGTGLPFSLGTMAVVDSDSVYTSVRLVLVPDLPLDTTVACIRYTLRGTGTFPLGFASQPRVWVEGHRTVGWRDTAIIDYSREVSFARIVSLTMSTVTVETHAYRVPGLGWLPAAPTAIHVGLTALGPPVSAEVADLNARLQLEVRTVPNPAHGAVVFRVDVPSAGWLKIRVLDVAGRNLATIVNGPTAAGRKEYPWNGVAQHGRRAAAGVYFVRVEGTTEALTRRFVLLGARP